ncbi:OmpA family protein [Aquimarina sp. ERC-38]|uniref:OmpA family protein n=1 Tax=Aquimarina sp. ERC-38 TaxID=2949996 RepID=UPI002246F974|nr:OmpA family protein [Aquimarina sp. ERC-38]UZO80259.1 OmpA family protein [Aquimarina sp. ERC-38]
MIKGKFKLFNSVKLWCILFVGMLPLGMYAQVEVPLLQRTQLTIKGDLTFVSNTILGKVSHDDGTQVFDPNKSYNDGGLNNQFKMGFIDIDKDPSTFNSSSADLIINSKCAKIKYVGLYWTASYADQPRSQKINELKIKYPGSSTYSLITDGLIIHDYKDDPASVFKQYSCYKDITQEVLNLPESTGTYTVANIAASTTASNPDPEVGNGLAAGWTMVVIYEDISLPQKRFYVYDGYVNIDANADPVAFSFDNFQTIPKGAVHGKIGVISYEGDKGIRGDRFQIYSEVAEKFKNLSDISNPVNNFFNANITENGRNVNTRNPASYNTLGYDADLFEIKNPNNSIIGNNQSRSTFKLLTDNDGYSVLAVAFSVEIYEPSLQIIKLSRHENKELIFPDDILKPKQKISYKLTIKNEGNDHAENTIIKDQLPEHVILLEESIQLPSKKVKYIFNAKDRTISFIIPNKYVKIDSEAFTINYDVLVDTSCELLAETGEVFIKDQLVTAEFNGSFNDTKRFATGYNYFNECKLPDYYPFNLAVDMSELQCPFVPADMVTNTTEIGKLNQEKGDENTSRFTESTGGTIKKDGINKNSDLEKGAPLQPEGTVTKTINDLIELNEIYFEFDKWEITKRAEVELQKVVDLMVNRYPDMIIKIETHSDSRGNEYYNLLLSQRRAESIYNYLVSKNISSNRIISYVGFGETKPVNNCGNDKNCSEEEYRKNRRSNFVIM